MKLRSFIVGLILNFFSGVLLNAAEQFSVLEEADRAYLSGDFSGALARYDDYLTRYPGADTAWETHYWKGRTLLALSRFVEAEKEFLLARDCVKDLVLRDEAWVGYADALYYVGEWEGALTQYSDLLDSSRAVERPYLLYQIGRIWKARGNTTKSDSFFQTLLKEAPHSYEASLLVSSGERAPEGLFYIQVGLFQVRKNLDRLLIRLKDLGYPCRVDEIVHRSKKVFRLRVGGFRNEKEARKVQFELERSAAMKGHVVRE